MANNLQLVISLPPHDEIQSTKEFALKGKNNLIKRVIRYRNGMKVTLIQTLNDHIFSVRIHSKHKWFRLLGGNVLSVQEGEANPLP